MGREWPTHLIDGIAYALAAIADEDLQGLRTVLNEETVAVPALLEWLDAAIGWEVNRRAGSCRTLNHPRTTITDQETRECSVVALAMLYAQLHNVAGVAEFFDVTADALCTVDGGVMAAHLH